MNTIKPLSENVQISKFDRTFNERDYVVRMHNLGRIFCMDWGRWVNAYVQPVEESVLEVTPYINENENFVSVSLKTNPNEKSYVDTLGIHLSVEQAAALRDQLNALDI